MKNSEQTFQLKTLIIDDDPFVRSTFELLFEEIGWALVTVESAEEALEVVEQAHFDVIVSDYGLPGMTGLDFFQQVMVSCPSTIHILMSAGGTDDLISRAYAIGVDDFLQKPFTLETLLATIAVHVRRMNPVYSYSPAAALAAA